MLDNIDSQLLMMELYNRGVTIRDIFGAYYEMEETNNNRSMTVEDAELAYGNTSFNPQEGF